MITKINEIRHKCLLWVQCAAVSHWDIFDGQDEFVLTGIKQREQSFLPSAWKKQQNNCSWLRIRSGECYTYIYSFVHVLHEGFVSLLSDLMKEFFSSSRAIATAVRRLLTPSDCEKHGLSRQVDSVGHSRKPHMGRYASSCIFIQATMSWILQFLLDTVDGVVCVSSAPTGL